LLGVVVVARVIPSEVPLKIDLSLMDTFSTIG